MIDYSQLAFVDTEATGLDPDQHQLWEVALIVGDDQYRWFLPVDLGRADPIALKIGGYHDRHPQRYGSDEVVGETDFAHPGQFAHDFAALTRGRHLVGAVISFDEERLRKLLRANGACPEWHYHLIDVEALAVGWRAGAFGSTGTTALPWDSEALSITVGVDPEKFDRHTALGDALWAKAVYEAVLA